MAALHDHPEYRGLLAAVLAAPADDLPRLVMADWLEEHQRTVWAELIRAQCEVERQPHAARIWADTFTDAEGVRPDWQEGLASARRVREVWRAAATEMFVGLVEEGQEARVTWDGRCFFGRPRGPGPHYEVCRGFVERVACPLARWFDRDESGQGWIGPRLLHRHPVQRVSLDRQCGGTANAWHADAGVDVSDVVVLSWLPWSVAVHLGEPTERRRFAGRPHRCEWYYPSPEDAHAALSAAAIAWAKAQPAGAA